MHRIYNTTNKNILLLFDQENSWWYLLVNKHNQKSWTTDYIYFSFMPNCIEMLSSFGPLYDKCSGS